MRTLRAGGLRLEPLVAAHAVELFPLLADPEIYRHLDESPPASLAWLRERYARLESRASPDGRQAWLNWVVRDAEGRAMGYVQATVEARTAWVAYVLGREHQGRGHATRAMEAMLGHIAAEHGVERFLAVVEADNAPSIRLLGRLGFKPVPAAERPAHLSPTERLFAR